jgi:hypothetical protein
MKCSGILQLTAKLTVDIRRSHQIQVLYKIRKFSRHRNRAITSYIKVKENNRVVASAKINC